MFQGFSERTIDFLWGIRLNNEKSWFEAHKDDFKNDLQAPMKELGREVFERVSSKFEGRGFITKLSRIYRDARRLRGRGLYRDNLWFSIERPSEEWTSTPVFWFELEPECWTYGMGFYMARPRTMAKLRARIDRDPKAFERLIAPLAKQDDFVLEGPEYARRKEAPTPRTAEWYNKKSFSLRHSESHGPALFSPELADTLTDGYSFLMPFYDYFISLDSDPDPAGSGERTS